MPSFSLLNDGQRVATKSGLNTNNLENLEASLFKRVHFYLYDWKWLPANPFATYRCHKMPPCLPCNAGTCRYRTTAAFLAVKPPSFDMPFVHLLFRKRVVSIAIHADPVSFILGCYFTHLFLVGFNTWFFIIFGFQGILLYKRVLENQKGKQQ